MLKGIPKIISPEILKILCEMGHGDELVISDANFPAASIAQRLVRADGIPAADMLEAVLKLIPLDQYDNEHFILMQKVPGDDKADTSAWDDYTKILKKESPESEPVFCERFAYYERAKKRICGYHNRRRAPICQYHFEKGLCFAGNVNKIVYKPKEALGQITLQSLFFMQP